MNRILLAITKLQTSIFGSNCEGLAVQRVARLIVVIVDQYNAVWRTYWPVNLDQCAL